jgi:hypothetical protein
MYAIPTGSIMKIRWGVVLRVGEYESDVSFSRNLIGQLIANQVSVLRKYVKEIVVIGKTAG